MDISIFDLFSIGVGPSSSHTVGPMAAAHRFVNELTVMQQLNRVEKIIIELYGSLALTGVGHATDKAVLLGLEGQHPATIDPDYMQTRFVDIVDKQQLRVNESVSVPFDIVWFSDQRLPKHANGMRFKAVFTDNLAFEEVYYSVGGGFIVREDEFDHEPVSKSAPYSFSTAKELFAHCNAQNLSIADIMMRNETSWHNEEEIRQRIFLKEKIMFECIERGLNSSGILPGGLNVERRAAQLYRKLIVQENNPLLQVDNMRWLTVFAMAVNEENAAGGRIVTAPTNGAAGIIPAVLKYYREFVSGSNDDGVERFFLTAGAIGILYKKQASISGAEVGCQGEVGVASSMAAGGLAAALGGSLTQIENAAEIAMEHHLGLTCDPVAGLVQIPCIERNAMGSIKAVNAASIALMEEGANKISLDRVIDTMRRTGQDMNSIYKETALGGLAVNIPEC